MPGARSQPDRVSQLGAQGTVGRALNDAWLTEKIELIHDQSRGVYGSPRIHAELRMGHDIKIGRKRVARLR